VRDAHGEAVGCYGMECGALVVGLANVTDVEGGMELASVRVTGHSFEYDDGVLC
jgi:hypothetical protein